ncbi:MAG: YlxR family protein [Ruminococcus sp.]|nr:YlxR family protein [Ruminococcus sp.]
MMSGSKQKKIPLRTCVGCGEVKPKREMTRIVKPKDGEASIDPTGKRSGRGAYICKSAECLRLAKKSRRLERSFSCAISDEVYSQMERELENERK